MTDTTDTTDRPSAADAPAARSTTSIVAAEAIGTAILMLGGPGTAIIGIGGAEGGSLAVALGFGFALLVAAYAIGHVSGCHINPAVTFGLWLVKQLDARMVPVYVGGQALGAAVGGGLIWMVASGRDSAFDASPSSFAANVWSTDLGFAGFWPMVLVEVVFTAVLVFVVLTTTRRGYVPAVAGLHAGITLALIHLASIPIDNTSVNPARSFGTALFAGGDAITQLWAFVVFPIIGAGFGGLLWITVEGAGAGAGSAGADLRGDDPVTDGDER
jgi:aquaporin Z